MRGLLPFGLESINDAADEPTLARCDVFIPADAGWLTFEFNVLQPGSNDWFQVSFNGTDLYVFRADSFQGTNYQHAEIPIGQFAGQAGVLEIRLNSGFNSAAELRVANLQLSKTSRLQISAPQFAANTGFGFTILSEIGNTYRIESSTNFVNWVEVETLVSTNTAMRFHDNTASNANHRFYRIVAH